MTAKERREKRKEERDDRRRYRLSEYNRRDGIECPKCGCRHFDVRWTRHRVGSVRRRKVCRNCGHRILTGERIIDDGNDPDQTGPKTA